MKDISRAMDRVSTRAPAIGRCLAWVRRTRSNRRTSRRATELARNVRHCNVCGWRGPWFDSFYSAVMKEYEETICPQCRAESRQRALFRYLRGQMLEDYLYKMSHRNFLCLEIGPDPSNPVEKALAGAIYVSVDVDGSRAMFAMDAMHLDFQDELFDLVVCSHVLEHMEDDLAAVSEMRRVLRQDGTAIIQVPVGYYGDPAGATTVDFQGDGPYGHFRSYGRDFGERLAQAGFEVRAIDFARGGPKELGIEKEIVFECKPRQDG